MTDEMLALARRNAAEPGVTNVHFLKGVIACGHPGGLLLSPRLREQFAQCGERIFANAEVRPTATLLAFDQTGL
jgi:hypothetical protein